MQLSYICNSHILSYIYILLIIYIYYIAAGGLPRGHHGALRRRGRGGGGGDAHRPGGPGPRGRADPSRAQLRAGHGERRRPQEPQVTDRPTD